MTMRITKGKVSGSLKAVVEEMADVQLSACFQCKKCSIGCPVTDQTQSPPAEIIRRLQLGAGDELLQTDLIWTCLSCETCYARCPNQINFAAVIDALKAVAVDKDAAKPQGDAPLFNRLFLSTVRSFGRSYDLLAIAFYKMRSGNMKQDMEKFPTMLFKGKLAVLPPFGADRGKLKRIFDKAAQRKGQVK